MFRFHAFLFHGLGLVALAAMIALHLLLVIVPSFLILKKLGYSGWWALVNYIPLGTVIGLWILATANWPLERRAEAATPA